MKEIDTLSFGYLFNNNKDKEIIEQKIKQKSKRCYSKERQEYYYVAKCNDYSFYYMEQFYCLIITLKHNLLLHRTDNEVKKMATKQVEKYFDIQNKNIKLENLNRIDYKNDYKYDTEEEFLIIKNILGKTKDKLYSYKKEIREDKGFYKAKYTSDGSGYVEIVFYDKCNEMLEELKSGNITINEALKYKNIFRTEVRIKNKKLNYEKYSKGTSKDIVNYYNEETAKMYMNNYTEKILGQEQFYRIDVATKIIQKAKDLKQNMKAKLCDLLSLINRKGFTYAKNSYNNAKTFITHLKRIKTLGINAITYDKHINGKKIEQEKMENFAKIQDKESINTTR